MLQPSPPAAFDAAASDAKAVLQLSAWVLIYQYKVSYNFLRQADGSFDRYLAEFLDRKVPANSNPVDGVATLDVVMDKATGLWGRLFFECETPREQIIDEEAGNEAGQQSAAENGEPDEKPRKIKPLLVYFHGGSFVHSSANSAIYDGLCRRLTKMCGAVILSANFRRAPEYRYPCAYEDGLNSVKWAQSANGRSCLAPLGCDPVNRCFLAGDSSGGNMAHNVAVRAAKEGVPVAGSILLMPMFGGRVRTPTERLLDGKYFVTMKDRDWYWRAFLPVGADRDHPACNPFSSSAASLTDVTLPPCLVVSGDLDLLLDWQLKFVYSLRKIGKPVKLLFLEQATMGFFLFPDTDHFNKLVEALRDFFRDNSPT